MHEISDEIRYRLLGYLEQHPEASQRELAKNLGVSLGKVNYCLRALIARGLVKMRNFRDSHNKLAYAYLLTPDGIDAKIEIISRFLRLKVEEYDTLSAEIDRLTAELKEIRQAQAS
jgi:MarR family transcriptional regulator, temperature-dependent positive regulator of motility